jgi:TetR/AcrR family transcriptional regulator, cholesterol catabolism regulator
MSSVQPASGSDAGVEPAGTLRRKRGKTSERLLAEAAQLFRQKGYAETTTRELADRLGVRKASLYHHISGKEDLLDRICRESLASIYETVSLAASGASPDERLRTIIRAHVVEAVRARDMHAVMLVEMRGLSPENRREVVALRDRYEELIRIAIVEGQTQGRIRTDIDSKYLTLSLLNVLNWTIFWFDPEGDLGAAELGDLLATVYLEGADA